MPFIILAWALLPCLPRDAAAQRIQGREVKGLEIKSHKVASGRERVKEAAGPASRDFEREKARQAALQTNEQLQSEKRKKMIELVTRLLASRTYKLSQYRTQRSMYLMRKADLEFEEGRYQNLRRYAAYEKEQQDFDAGRRKEKPEPPKSDYTDAIATYQKLVTEDPDFSRGDEARFRLGYCLNQMGRSADAARVLSELVQRHPKSPLVADAYLQMGEIWFDANKFIAAMGNYQMVYRKYPKSVMAGYAEYKYAWSLHHQNKHGEAIAAMQSVVSNRAADLKEQALRDLVSFYTELTDGFPRARDYFLKVGGKEVAQRLLWRMARTLDSQDKNLPSLEVLAWLLAQYPTALEATHYHQLQVDILVRLRTPERLDAALRSIVAFYSPGSAWISAHRSKPAVAASGRQLAEKALAYVATYYHREGKAGNREDLLRRAVNTYSEFLKQFHSSKQAPAMRFYLAELLRHFEDHDVAATRYGEVVASGPSPFREDAAFQQVFCLAQLLTSKGLDRPVPTKVGSETIPKTPLAPLEKRFVAASDDFARLFPTSKDAPSILFKAGRIFYDHGLLEEAGRRFGKVIETHPKDRYAALSGAMALDSYSRLRDWPQVVKWARHLIGIRNYQLYSRAQLRSIIAASGIKAAEILEKQKKYEEAALAMKAVYDEFPKDRNAFPALWNTAVLFEKAGQLSRAITLYEQVRVKAPRTEFAAKATFVLGALHESRADFAKAAMLYAELAQLPQIPETPDALHGASVMHEALGNAPAAEKIRRQYVTLYPNRPDATQAFFSIGKLLESQKKWPAAEKFYLDFVSSPHAKKAPTLLVAAWTRAGRTVRRSAAAQTAQGQKRQLSYFQNAVTAFTQNKLQPGTPAADYAGWARFQLAEVLFDRFEAVKLEGTGPALVRLLIEKAKRREAAQREYQAVLPYRALVWSTAAVYRIGMLYARTVESLYSIPVPKGMTKPEEIEQYKAVLQERAQPVEEAALGAFRKAVEVAHRLRVYNKYTVAAASRLMKLDPEQYPDPVRPVLLGGYAPEPQLARPILERGTSR
ncbi:MAG: tetratricopeptide repeat protein [Polyangia bacterium]|jgi:TolA-binding protein|nr:tetratricopeptide repeat protein [Polyangia bacterium]